MVQCFLVKCHSMIFILIKTIAIAFPAAANKNAKKKIYESLKGDLAEEDSTIIKEKATATGSNDEESVSARADGQCGPGYGNCRRNQCCSLDKKCGTTAAHCNVSLGCRRKYGVCHWIYELFLDLPAAYTYVSLLMPSSMALLMKLLPTHPLYKVLLDPISINFRFYLSPKGIFSVLSI